MSLSWTISQMKSLTWSLHTHSSESKGDVLEGKESLENYGISGETHNNHTNDAKQDEMTTVMFASSLQSNPTPANNN